MWLIPNNEQGYSGAFGVPPISFPNNAYPQPPPPPPPNYPPTNYTSPPPPNAYLPPQTNFGIPPAGYPPAQHVTTLYYPSPPPPSNYPPPNYPPPSNYPPSNYPPPNYPPSSNYPPPSPSNYLFSNGFGVGAAQGGYARMGMEEGGYSPSTAPSFDGRPSPLSSSGRRRALVIGINYFKNSKIQLKGCINDAHTICAFLLSRGFSSSQIRTLTDDQPDPSRQPTKANILRDIRWLTKGAASGDSLFFHFSGHGSQVVDTNGDEDDGLDETILPVDYDKAGQIIDDDLHDMLVKTLPAGCKLTAVMDCCHSGTGLDLPYIYSLNSNTPSHSFSTSINVTDFLNTKLLKKKAKKIIIKRLSQALLKGGKSDKWTGGDCFLFSGCRDDQTSADTHFNGKAQGATTYSFTQSLIRNPNPSYFDLLRSMRDILKEKGYSQIPQLSSQREFDMTQPFSI